jgi:arginyl-tRNA synthetase
MNIESNLKQHIAQALQELFGLQDASITLQSTLKDFEGSHTLLLFPYLKPLQRKPEEIGQAIGDYLVSNSGLVHGYNVVKGFLNLSLTNAAWLASFDAMRQNDSFGILPAQHKKVMVEFSSPNTNKPLHLGHLRNIFLGWSLSQILKACGYEVIKANLINDRGIHICKSMLAYQKAGKNETPASSGMKGDHLVGKYYVEFDKALKQELAPMMKEVLENKNVAIFSETEQTTVQNALKKIEDLKKPFEQTLAELTLAEFENFAPEIIEKAKETLQNQKGFKALAKDLEKGEVAKKVKNLASLEAKIEEETSHIKEIVQAKTALMKEAQKMLQDWEAGKPEVIELWKTMNGWVFEGFHQTYEKIGVSFDKMYYESNTYKLGKDIVQEGLEKGVFAKEPNGAVSIDLTADGLDKKVVQRGDGTSVYITQDMGTADLKYQDFQIDKSVYVVGNEQDYHFKVLFSIMQKLGRSYGAGMYHLSYGMVELPQGKMKSREGTVVDADDLVSEMERIAEEKTKELGKLENLTPEELPYLYEMIALGALKYFLLKVEPKKTMLFNPEESVNFHGDAAPFIQYNHARSCAILRKAAQDQVSYLPTDYSAYKNLHSAEIDLVAILLTLPAKVEEAGEQYAPSVLAQYSYEVAKGYSKFFSECSIFKADTPEARAFRIALSAQTAYTLKFVLNLLGIDVPEKM